jgi:release factor glutamine methyltransferase
MRLVTVPGVFRPRSDSRLLAARVAERAGPGISFLDPFTGSGILAIAAAGAGASATAIDISRRAVACAALNARLNGVEVRALRGDLFAPVAGERFDLIAANPPYVPAPGDEPARGAARAWDAGADGRALLDRFCAEVPARLAPGGRLLLTHSSVCGTDETLAMLTRSGLEVEVIERDRGPLGPLMAARAELLERRGLLEPGAREEEVLVFEGRLAADSEAAPRVPSAA